MGEFPASRSLLERTIRRLYVARIGRAIYWAAVVSAVLYGVLLLVGRLTGLVRDWFTPPTIGLIPLTALVISLLWIRRPSASEAARHVDRHERTQDLYLTLTMLDAAAGEYKPLVGRDAEARAGTIEPARIVPWKWQRPLLQVGGCLLALLVGMFVLPSLDPFGKVAAAKEAEIRHEQLQQSRKATEVRTSQLAKSDADAETTEDVKKSLEDLQADLRRMEPKQREDNARSLATHQKNVGEKWRLNAEQLKHLLSQTPLGQRFGEARRASENQWLKQLQEGDPKQLQEDLEELQEDLKTALGESDPVKRTEAMRRLQKKLDEMRDFARDQANSKPLAAALERALKQLESMSSSELSQEASEAAAESMKLASMELKQLAQSMRDLKQLEKALEAVQMAKKLNAEEKLDGEACENCQSMADYAELYAEMMAQLGYDVAMGEGEGGTGRGERDEASEPMAEDESAKTDFKDETSKSTVQKGKILLSIKTKGVSESDDEELDLQYQTVVRELKQSVSEAIEQEQVPPGYHEGIKKYFDSLDESQPE
jgi:hypothetical protein